MTYVITENCIKCKYTDCVEVCPVDCFHEGPNFLVINPDECIDCSLCEPECPINAIISDEDITDDNREFLEINERLSKKWPILTEIKDPPADGKGGGGRKDFAQAGGTNKNKIDDAFKAIKDKIS